MDTAFSPAAASGRILPSGQDDGLPWAGKVTTSQAFALDHFQVIGIAERREGAVRFRLIPERGAGNIVLQR